MATRSALNTLIDLANKDADEAAKRLGEVLRICEEADQKLDLLQQYRDDYALRCQTSLANGISATHFNNFQVFMQKLDHAIVGQQTVVSHAKQRADQARAAWLVCEQKKMSFVTLSDRANKEDARRESWRDQKQNDEHAARTVSHKRDHT
jgi:flagellar FliJ protein